MSVPRRGNSGAVSASDRKLIEWVAQARSGDAIPAEFLVVGGPEAMNQICMRLVELGITKAAIGMPINGDLVRDDARRWLEANPDG